VRGDVLVERDERLAKPSQRALGQTWRGDGPGEREPDRVEPSLSHAAVSFSDVGDQLGQRARDPFAVEGGRSGSIGIVHCTRVEVR
jgi:hypothetical protein